MELTIETINQEVHIAVQEAVDRTFDVDFLTDRLEEQARDLIDDMDLDPTDEVVHNALINSLNSAWEDNKHRMTF